MMSLPHRAFTSRLKTNYASWRCYTIRISLNSMALKCIATKSIFVISEWGAVQPLVLLRSPLVLVFEVFVLHDRDDVWIRQSMLLHASYSSIQLFKFGLVLFADPVHIGRWVRVLSGGLRCADRRHCWRELCPWVGGVCCSRRYVVEIL